VTGMSVRNGARAFMFNVKCAPNGALERILGVDVVGFMPVGNTELLV